MAAVASSILVWMLPSDTPLSRLNEIVADTNNPWWLTASGVLVSSTCASADSGTRWPPLPTRYTSFSACAFC
ncbi:hypothetical protein GALL_524010 [mine drainage metagenome]|uniref:Uncharacterized protein n=1 Tax=mine drainage metagenome TaxID=410659 RepID=A0A1J5PL72_9ZZZZ